MNLTHRLTITYHQQYWNYSQLRFPMILTSQSNNDRMTEAIWRLWLVQISLRHWMDMRDSFRIIITHHLPVLSKQIFSENLRLVLIGYSLSSQSYVGILARRSNRSWSEIDFSTPWLLQLHLSSAQKKDETNYHANWKNQYREKEDFVNIVIKKID